MHSEGLLRLYYKVIQKETRTNESWEPYCRQRKTRNPQSDEKRCQEDTKTAATSGDCPRSNGEDDCHSSISTRERKKL